MPPEPLKPLCFFFSLFLLQFFFFFQECPIIGTVQYVTFQTGFFLLAIDIWDSSMFFLVLMVYFFQCRIIVQGREVPRLFIPSAIEGHLGASSFSDYEWSCCQHSHAAFLCVCKEILGNVITGLLHKIMVTFRIASPHKIIDWSANSQCHYV